MRNYTIRRRQLSSAQSEHCVETFVTRSANERSELLRRLKRDRDLRIENIFTIKLVAQTSTQKLKLKRTEKHVLFDSIFS